jgi:hypothetical protein
MPLPPLPFLVSQRGDSFSRHAREPRQRIRANVNDRLDRVTSAAAHVRACAGTIRLPIAPPATPVTAAAEQHHDYDDNQN